MSVPTNDDVHDPKGFAEDALMPTQNPGPGFEQAT